MPPRTAATAALILARRTGSAFRYFETRDINSEKLKPPSLLGAAKTGDASRRAANAKPDRRSIGRSERNLSVPLLLVKVGSPQV